MLSKNQIKYITSLAVKKYRKKYGCFLVEGVKMVEELLHSTLSVQAIFATPIWLEQHPLLAEQYVALITEVNDKGLKKISCLKTPNQVLAIAEIPEISVDKNNLLQTHSLVLDNIQDPGNLGTIIRTADWFGLSYVFCSENCVDVYNPKVVQASMGSVFRIKVLYVSLEELFTQYAELPVYGALLNGENAFQLAFKKNGFLLIGNESKGISKCLHTYIHHPISIPKYGVAESLNAAIATGILCALLRGKQ